MNHLSSKIKELAEQNAEKRIESILSDGWIGYPRAKEIHQRMEEMYNHPKVLRMPNMLLVGPTNNGKTHILNRFFLQHKPIIKDEDTHLIAPVVYVQAPPKPDPKMFYTAILDKLGAPYGNDKVYVKHQQVIHLLRKVQTKVLIIDEIHHTVSGPYSVQRVFLNVIKFLSNELQIIIIAAGVKDAYNAINADPQLSNRFEPIGLPKWQMNDEYLRLLASFESVLPLRNPSNLIEPDIASHILSRSEGCIGEISSIIKKAAIKAIESKSEKITLKILSAIHYTSPSNRKKQLESFIL